MPAGVTTPSFDDAFRAEDFIAALERSNGVGRPLSLVVHLPFCRQACDTCSCHRIASLDTRIVEPYLTRLDREMVLTSRHLDTSRQVRQLHWVGGPTLLTLAQMGDLVDRLDARFGLSTARERDYSIDIDPGEADLLTLRHLQALGFNRLSIDVRDIDPRVQQAIDRNQPWGLTESLIDEAARLGFRSLNLDLVYGLPLQTPESFAATLREVIAIAPARLSFFRHGHGHGQISSRQCRRSRDLPDAEGIQRLLLILHAMLSAAGYVHLGGNHFAQPSECLARAWHPGSLSQAPCDEARRISHDRLGLGLSAVSRVYDVFVANATCLADYEAALDSGKLAILGGLRLVDTKSP